eukprot:scaffold136734_cov38-Prasinocladus_malaysianus.AAC.1
MQAEVGKLREFCPVPRTSCDLSDLYLGIGNHERGKGYVAQPAGGLCIARGPCCPVCGEHLCPFYRLLGGRQDVTPKHDIIGAKHEPPQRN